MAPTASSAAPPVRGAADLAAVLAARAGDASAFGELFARWADRVHDLALRIVRDHDAAADVTQEAFEVAWRRLPSLEQPLAFGGWLLRIARNRALDRLGRDGRAIPAGDALDGTGAGVGSVVDDAAPATVEAAEAGALLWEAGAALAPRDASILDLHLRHGMAASEIATELDVSPTAAHQMLHRLRGRLREAVRATVLWQRGAPACAVLRSDLRQAGVTRLDAVAVSVIGDHADRCDPCAERRRARLAPEALFGLAPLLALPPVARATVGQALTGAPSDAPSAATHGEPASDHARPSTPDGGDAPPGDRAPSPAEGAARVPNGTGLDPVPATPAGHVRRSRPGRAAAAAAAAVVLLLAAVAAAAAPTSSTVEVAPRSGGAPAPAAAEPSTPDQASGGGAGVEQRPAAEAAPAPVGPATSTPDVGSTPSAPEDGSPSEPPEGADTPSPGAGVAALGEEGAPPSPPAPDPPPTRPEVAPEAPVVLSLTATRSPRPGCATPSAAIVVAWRTTGADGVGLVGSGAPTGVLPTSGTAVVCSPTAATYVLAASGPGGTTEAVVTVG